MSNVKHVVFLLLLLPALALAAEPKSIPQQGTPSSTGKPTRPPLSVFFARSEPRCYMTTLFSATSWYKATMCAQLHKEMRPQEEKVKKLIASTYPAFYRAITMPPFSAAGRQTIDDSPSLPEANPALSEAACKQNFDDMMRSIKNAKTKKTILRCWEEPAAVAKGKPFSPMDDRVCVGTAQYMASAWYQAGMCTARHKDLAAREAKVKQQLAATYPDFQKTISMPPILDAGKSMATYSLSNGENDPSLSEEGCKQNLDFLASPLKNTDWKESVVQCWGKPRTAGKNAPSVSAAR